MCTVVAVTEAPRSGEKVSPRRDETRTDPYRLRRGWSPTARLQATNQLRVALGERRRLLDVAEAGASFFCHLMVAKTVTVTTLIEDRYQDLVNIGELTLDDERFPPDTIYPVSMYPLTTHLLTESGGYLSSDPADPVFQEIVTAMPYNGVNSLMGVAVVSGGTVRGEVGLTRGHGEPAFNREDFEVARDLATAFGSRLAVALHRPVLDRD